MVYELVCARACAGQGQQVQGVGSRGEVRYSTSVQWLN